MKNYIITYEDYERFGGGARKKIKAKAENFIDLIKKLAQKGKVDMDFYTDFTEEDSEYVNFSEEELISELSDKNGDGGAYFTIIDADTGKVIINSEEEEEEDLDETTNKLIEALEKLTNKKVNLAEAPSQLVFQLTPKGKYLIADLTKFNELLRRLEIEDDFNLGEDGIDSQSVFGAAQVFTNLKKSRFTLDELIKEVGDDEFVTEELIPLYLKQGYIVQGKYVR